MSAKNRIENKRARRAEREARKEQAQQVHANSKILATVKQYRRFGPPQQQRLLPTAAIDTQSRIAEMEHNEGDGHNHES